MNEIQSTSKLVKETLINDPATRNSDNYLYYVICRDLLAKIGINIDNISLPQALLCRKSLFLPPFETVRRTRQKAQEKCPELAALPEVEAKRAELEEEYREFARG